MTYDLEYGGNDAMLSSGVYILRGIAASTIAICPGTDTEGNWSTQPEDEGPMEKNGGALINTSTTCQTCGGGHLGSLHPAAGCKPLSLGIVTPK